MRLFVKRRVDRKQQKGCEADARATGDPAGDLGPWPLKGGALGAPRIHGNDAVGDLSLPLETPCRSGGREEFFPKASIIPGFCDGKDMRAQRVRHLAY